VLAERPTAYSLHAKWLDPYFQQAALEEKTKLLDKPQLESKQEKKVNEFVSSKPRESFSSKKNILDKLD
jgi:hypothetical protein